MEHADALERIEIAAAEPEGLERLMAGDTPEAAAVAGHLAGCPSCTDELARIRSSSAIARDVIRAEPDPALRERTLAFVRAVGRDRSPAGRVAFAGPVAVGPADGLSVATPVAAEPVAEAPAAVEATVAPAPIPIDARRRRNLLGWAAAAAAVVLVVAGAGYVAGGAAGRSDTEANRAETALLADTAATALRIGAQPDAQTVALTATPANPQASGSLAFSAKTGELVAVAWDLQPEAEGQEYGCWVEVDGTRQRLGRMYWAGRMWTWAGPVAGLDALPPGAVFGVSLTSTDVGPGVPVLTGSV